MTRIAFDVGAIIDSSQVVTTEGDHLVLFLDFAEGRMCDRLLLSEKGGGSSLHGFMHELVSDEFDGPA